MTSTRMAGAVSVVSLAAAVGYWRWHRRPVQTPPGTVPAPLAWAGPDDIPLIGVATRLKSVITDPVGLVLRNQARYGDVFTLRVPTIYDFTFLLDPSHYAAVMSLPTDHAGVGAVLHKVPTVGYWFPRERSDPESLQKLILAGRRLMAEMLPAVRVRDLPSTVPDIVKRHTSQWSDVVDLTAVVHPIVYEVTGRYFTGDAIWDELGPRLTRYFRHIADGIDIVRTTLSITPYHYVMPEYRSTRKLYRMLRDELVGFHAAESPLLRGIESVRIDGVPLSAPDRLWMFMYVLWNATAYPGTYTYWTLVDVLEQPGMAARLQALPTAAERIEFLRRCLQETVRLHPVSSLIRFLAQPYEFEHEGAVVHIPAGQAVGVFPGTLNRDARLVRNDPDAYDPDRYLQDPAPKPATFGRGPFGCIAQMFSEVATASVLDDLLQRYDISMAGDLPPRRERVHQTYPCRPLPARLAAR